MSNNANTPTFKQKLFAQKYVEYKGNGAKAALEVYDVKNGEGKSIAYQNLQKPIVQEEIKKLLDKSGLDLEHITNLTNNAIDHNLQYGKASQAVGADLLKFVFKLHNVIPANKNMSVKLTRNEMLPSKDMKDIKVLLTKISETTNSILADTKP